jgi:two-component system, chemotaxis family, response regulator PixH
MSVALVVDDTLTQLEIISSCLRKGGFTVVTAGTGEEALTLINAQKPDIVILDVVLPGRSGFEVCRDLKADENTKQIPVILCSTKGSDMDKFWGMKQGADAYIPKPVDQEQLLQTVKQLVKG